ncbi:MAG: anaerobic ribonucleoside-triphosphate reductase [Hominimerdicola sp.]
MIKVNVLNGTLSNEEINAYVERANQLYPEKAIDAIDIKLDGEYVDVDYHFSDVPFQRIRRITGYLVGTLDRFNNAKRAEVGDRVKHGITN